MNPDHAALLAEVRQKTRAGKRDQARRLLERQVRLDPGDYQAWLWLGGLSESASESLKYITQARALEPSDPAVLRAYDWALRRIEAAASPANESARPAGGETEASTAILQASTTLSRAKDGCEAQDGLIRTKESSLRPLFAGLVAGGVAALIFVAAVLVWQAWSDRQVRANVASEVAFVEGVGAGEATGEPTSSAQSMVADRIAPAPNLPGPTETATPIPSPTPNPLQPKEIITGKSDPRLTWTPTPQPTATPSPSPTWAPTYVNPLTNATLLMPTGLKPIEHWIDVSLDRQTLVAYEGSFPVFESLVSTGTARYPTVTGQFRIWLRFKSQDMDGYRLGYDYYLRNVPYVQYFYQDYALHGTFWHSNFGVPMSHGCVNLPTPAAEWLFNWASYGTFVNIHR